MIRRIDHVSIAVRDLARAKAFFIDVLGGKNLFEAPVPGQKFRWTTLEMGTSCFIELIDPLEKDSLYSGFWTIGERGPTTSPSRWTTSKRFTENWKKTGSPPLAWRNLFPTGKRCTFILNTLSEP